MIMLNNAFKLKYYFNCIYSIVPLLETKHNLDIFYVPVGN